MNNLSKKFPEIISYVAFGIVTAGLISGLTIWCIQGDEEMVIKNHEALLQCDEPLQTEYLVNQPLNTDGLKLNIGSQDEPHFIEIEKCQINADFSSSGRKKVEIIYSPDIYNNYVASFDVNVLFVRSAYIEQYPSLVNYDGDNLIFSDDFSIKAILSSKPNSDIFGEAKEVEQGYEIEVNQGMYTYSCLGNESLENYYDISLFLGNNELSFSVYNTEEKSFIVSSINDIVSYQSEDNASLKLIVTDKDETYQMNSVGKSNGFYVYQNDGKEEIIPFSYQLTEKEEIFSSLNVEEIILDNKYQVNYQGKVFTCEKNQFQSAVVNGNIITDHGYKAVINSNERILNFTYDPSNINDETDPDYGNENANREVIEGTLPTLTLYITQYDMNPLLGTGNGYSQGVYIYTDQYGNAYRLPFYLQAWVWTYVPLSSNYSDVYSDVNVSDFVYKYDAPVDLRYNSYYRGVLYVNISQFVRGEGEKNIRFSAPEELWLHAIMGL